MTPDPHGRPTPPTAPATQRVWGWGGKFVHPDDDPRPTSNSTVEKEVLMNFLHDQRLTLELKCAGLTPEQLARRAVPPSDLSLLGLVRHMADVERHWFRDAMSGHDSPPHFWHEDDLDFHGAVADPEVVAHAWRVWRAEMAHTDAFVAAEPDLCINARKVKPRATLREILVHMIEEYGRHNGHADFLRERIDGRVGH